MQRQDKLAYNEILSHNKTTFMSYIFMDIEAVMGKLTESLVLEDDPHNKTILQGKIRGLAELMHDWQRTQRQSV